ncbi:ABC transporter ATP-binding protein/permease [Phormidium tenue FACHB-886]|nr:ABC transporter ATP-binding protein/permease [Phormidium tenue FACHB-886]
MTTVSSPPQPSDRLNRFDLSLWKRFVAIAQPYWYPTERQGGKVFFALLALLIVFLFAFLFGVVSLSVLLLQALFPQFMAESAGGLSQLIQAIITSPAIGIVIAALVIPAIAFFLVRRRILPRWQQWSFLGLLLLLSLSVSGMNVLISYVGNFFSTALAEKNAPVYWRYFFIYAAVFVVATPFTVFYSYIRDWLGLRWRNWMTDRFLARYFQNRSYYQINLANRIDNPDQRISEDINSFTMQSLRYLLLVLGAIISVISFTGILWSISPFLAVFLVGYAIFGTAVAAWFGRRLIALRFNQLRREADFRYGLVHVRDNAESIAFYRGEPQEVGQLQRRFAEVIRNFFRIITWQRNLTFFNVPYEYATYILPAVIIAPLYFNGQLQFGDITQASYAFARIYEAFSIFVQEIIGLSAFAAGINRLETFVEALDDQDRPVDLPMIKSIERDQLSLDHLTLMTPNGERTLVEDLTTTLEPGQGLVIVGHSGVGKSSMLRGIAGLWNTGSGQITRPPLGEMLFLPQRPYMVLGTLRSQLVYPNTDSAINEATLRRVLAEANLSDLPDRLGGFEVELDFADVLSLGEQQRLAFARLLLARPQYAILDEATSALDIENEQRLYQRIRELGITFISVGHRPSLLRYHDYVLQLQSGGTWQLTPAQEYGVDAEAFT